MDNKKTIGIVAGKFLPLHYGHLYLINTAVSYVDVLYIVVCEDELYNKKLCHGKCKYPNLLTRYHWINASLSKNRKMKIFSFKQKPMHSDAMLKNWYKDICELINSQIDYYFTADEENIKLIKKYFGNTKPFLIDKNRSVVPISATKIRENLSKNFNYLPPIVQSFYKN